MHSKQSLMLLKGGILIQTMSVAFWEPILLFFIFCHFQTFHLRGAASQKKVDLKGEEAQDEIKKDYYWTVSHAKLF